MRIRIVKKDKSDGYPHEIELIDLEEELWKANLPKLRSVAVGSKDLPLLKIKFGRDVNDGELRIIPDGVIGLELIPDRSHRSFTHRLVFNGLQESLSDLVVIKAPRAARFGTELAIPVGLEVRKTPADTPELTQSRRELNELISAVGLQIPEVLKQVQRNLRSYERLSRIKSYVIKSRGRGCQLCKELRFVKKNGHRYCEIHHLFQLSKNPIHPYIDPGFLVVLCATCHRRMHYGDVGEPIREGNGFRVRIDKEEHVFQTELPFLSKKL